MESQNPAWNPVTYCTLYLETARVELNPNPKLIYHSQPSTNLIYLVSDPAIHSYH